MRETKTICNECGADMINEAPSMITASKKTVIVKGVSFEIEQRVNSISRLDNGTDYDICSKCRDDVLINSMKNV